MQKQPLASATSPLKGAKKRQRNLLVPEFRFPSKHHLLITTKRHVCLWDGHALSAIFKSDSAGILQAKAARDGSGRLAVADDSTVLVHNVGRGMDDTYRLKGSQGILRCIEFSADSRSLFFTTHISNSVQEYSFTAERLLEPFYPHPSPPNVLAISATTHLAVSASKFPSVLQVQSLVTRVPPLILVPCASDCAIVVAVFHPRFQDIFLLGFADGTIAMYDASKINNLQRLNSEKYLKRQHDGEVGKITRLWRVGGKRTQFSIAEAVSITAAAFVTESRARAVIVGNDGKCRLVDFSRGGEVLRTWYVRGPATCISIISSKTQLSGGASTPSDVIAVGLLDGRILLYNSIGLRLQRKSATRGFDSVLGVAWVKAGLSKLAKESPDLDFTDHTSIDVPDSRTRNKDPIGTNLLDKMAIDKPDQDRSIELNRWKGSLNQTISALNSPAAGEESSRRWHSWSSSDPVEWLSSSLAVRSSPGTIVVNDGNVDHTDHGKSWSPNSERRNLFGEIIKDQTHSGTVRHTKLDQPFGCNRSTTSGTSVPTLFSSAYPATDPRPIRALKPPLRARPRISATTFLANDSIGEFASTDSNGKAGNSRRRKPNPSGSALSRTVVSKDKDKSQSAWTMEEQNAMAKGNTTKLQDMSPCVRNFSCTPNMPNVARQSLQQECQLKFSNCWYKSTSNALLAATPRRQRAQVRHSSTYDGSSLHDHSRIATDNEERARSVRTRSLDHDCVSGIVCLVNSRSSSSKKHQDLTKTQLRSVERGIVSSTMYHSAHTILTTPQLSLSTNVKRQPSSVHEIPKPLTSQQKADELGHDRAAFSTTLAHAGELRARHATLLELPTRATKGMTVCRTNVISPAQEQQNLEEHSAKQDAERYGSVETDASQSNIFDVKNAEGERVRSSGCVCKGNCYTMLRKDVAQLRAEIHLLLDRQELNFRK